MKEPNIEEALRAQRMLESVVRGHLDDTLEPRGFVLSPQGFALSPTGDVMHSVVYEADPGEYECRYPALRRRFHGEVSCIDLWIHLGADSGPVRAELEGDDIVDLLLEVDAALPAEAGDDLDSQLSALADALRVVLDEFRKRP